jgi:hypothetical protein
MDIKPLLNLSCAKVASMIKGASNHKTTHLNTLPYYYEIICLFFFVYLFV